MTRSRIFRARATLSEMAAANRGDGREMSSRANRTAAMMAAAITNVLAKRPSRRCRSSNSSRRRISPMTVSIGEDRAKTFNRPSVSVDLLNEIYTCLCMLGSGGGLGETIAGLFTCPRSNPLITNDLFNHARPERREFFSATVKTYLALSRVFCCMLFV